MSSGEVLLHLDGDEFEVDWDKMLEKTLRGPIARVLEALDISWEEVKSGQEQTGLGKFM